MKRIAPGLFIETTQVEIKSECHKIPKGKGFLGGVICTGFIDVEKVLRHVILHKRRLDTTHFLLEKKLPFQVVLLAFDEDDRHRDDSDSDDSDDSSGSESDTDASCRDDEDEDHYR